MAGKKTPTEKLTGTQQVTLFLEQLQHPLKTEIQEVRSIILNANHHLTEHIKWNAPSFSYAGEDRITFNLPAKNYFRLVFHSGTKKVYRCKTGRLLDDQTKLLKWITDDRAVAEFTGMADVSSKKEALIEVINKWIDATSQQP